MIQTTDGAFKLIESDHSQKVNSVESQKIDELTGKVDQLLKTTKGKSSAWRRLWLGRFRTLKRLLQMLKRKEKISKASHGTFRVKILFSVRHKTSSWVRIIIRISRSRRATSKLFQLSGEQSTR